jgi:osmotically-inducible protein OsmY
MLDGRVTLRGKVDSDTAKAAAAVAGKVEGVKSVRNDLQVVPPRGSEGGRHQR